MEIVDGVLIEATNEDIENGIIRIPDKVFLIKKCALKYVDMKEVFVPDSVTEIPDWCFTACEKLENVHLGRKTIKLGREAFVGCENLRTIKLPNTVTEIGYRCFARTAIKSVELPNSIQKIGYRVFEGTRLEEVMISGNINVYSNSHAFAGALNIKRIIYNEGEVHSYEYIYGQAYEILDVVEIYNNYEIYGVKEIIGADAPYPCVCCIKVNGDIEGFSDLQEARLYIEKRA